MRRFEAVNNALKFTHPTGDIFQISEFTSDSLLVFDVTEPGNTSQVSNLTISGGNPYTLAFELAVAGGDRTFMTLAADEIKTPLAMVADDPSDLAATDNAADYILIAPRTLGWDDNGDRLTWLDALVNLRASQGLRVKAVKAGDIYDEFSYGLTSPSAIREFLKYAYDNWTAPAPRYVLLVGDSTYNPKNNLDPIFGQDTKEDYLQSYLSYTTYQGETVTDEWFGRISGEDIIPDIYIGRLPAANSDQADDMVAKIIDYEMGLGVQSWQKDILLVADNPTEDWEQVFETMNEDAAALIPAGMNAPAKGYLGDYLDQGFAPADLNTDLTAAINSGALIVNYSGHGGIQLWANERILDVDDVNALTNDQQYPFFISMSCRAGYFAYPEIGMWAPYLKSLGEELLRVNDSGAAAAFVPTGMTAIRGQHILNTSLFEAIFTEDIRELGPAIASAKMTLLANGDAEYEDVSKTFLLFGDPAMKLKVPVPRRPTGLTAEQDAQYNVALSWQAAVDANGDPVDGYNVYRKMGAEGVYAPANSELVTNTGFVDEDVTLGTRYYYVVRSVDMDPVVAESVDSESVSIVPTAPAASLGGAVAGNSHGGGGGGCFVSTASEAFNRDIMRGLTLFGVIIVFGMLATRRKAYDSRHRA
jgi:hypothetical protein